MKIDIEKIRTIPELLKTKSREEIAKEWAVSVGTVSYWIGQLRSKGLVIENKKVKKLIDSL